MEYKGKKFDAIVATPGAGKSFLCDNYPDLFVDADEVRRRLEKNIPEDISRQELERTKGQKVFAPRLKGQELLDAIYEKLDKAVKEGKIIVSSPHDILIDYLVNRNIKFCFVHAAPNMREELVERYKKRGNDAEFIKKNDDLFDEYIKKDKKEDRTDIKYEFSRGEYLSDIVEKFGIKLGARHDKI